MNQTAKRRKISFNISEPLHTQFEKTRVLTQVNGLPRHENDDIFIENLLKSYHLENNHKIFFVMSKLVRTLPYVIRIHVLDFVSVKATRFYYDNDRYEELLRRREDYEIEVTRRKELRRIRRKKKMEGKETESSGKEIDDEEMLNSVDVIEENLLEEFDTEDEEAFRPTGKYLYSYELKAYVGVNEYIKLLYGRFVEDHTRKIYLVFGYLVFRSNLHLRYIPKRHMRQLYTLNGGISPQYLSSLPDNLRSVCFSDIVVHHDSMIELVNRLPLEKFAIQRVEGLNTEELMMALKKVRIVRVMDCKLEDNAAAHLFSSRIIENINLNNNMGLTSRCVMPMKDNKAIVHFRMNNTCIDDDCVEAILQNKNIREIQISRTKISEAGFWILVSSHPRVRVFEIMDTDRGIDYTYGISPKGGNEVQMETNGNEVSSDSDDDDEMVEENVNQTTPSRRSIFNITGNILRKSFTPRKKKKEGLTYPNLKNLSGQVLIEKMYFDCTPLKGRTLGIICSLPNLSFLSLISSNMSDDKIEYVLQNAKKLEKIQLGYNDRLTIRTPDRIADFPNIKDLEYCQRSLTRETIRVLFNNINLEFLYVHGYGMTDECFQYLRKNFTLKTLQLCGEQNSITPMGMEYLQNCTNVVQVITGTEERPIIWVRDESLPNVYLNK